MKSKSTLTTVALLVALALVSVAYIGELSGPDAYAIAAEENRLHRAQLAEMSKYDTQSTLFRAVAKAVTPAVVEIRVTKKVAVGNSGAPDMDDFMRRFFGDQMPQFPGQRIPQRNRPRSRIPREYLQKGLGSGVIVDAKNGYILTNNHVVVGADTVEVILDDKRKFEAEWVRRDSQTDMAVVKIKADNLTEAPLGDSDAVDVGDWVLAIGSPRGLQHTVTAGIISAKSRVTGKTGYENLLQTDAAINKGNSGGPLVNMKGQVVGINNSIASSSGGSEGIGFAIPSNMARRIMEQLISNGKVVRGFLGVSFQMSVSEKLAEDLGLPSNKGVLVTEVGKDTPAERAELREEDFIVTIDGIKVENGDALRKAVANIEPGRQVDIVIYREGKKMTLPITLAAQPENMAAVFGEAPQPGQSDSTRYGLTVETLTEEIAAQAGYEKSLQGVIVTNVANDSDADEQGIVAGMVIDRVMGKAVSNADEFAQAISSKEAKSGVRLRVMSPSGGKKFVFITPASK